MYRTTFIDVLETRRLLAGVTFLAHGINGTIDGWVASAANAIVQRAGGEDAAAVYTMTLGKSGGNVAVTGFSLDEGSIPLAETTNGEAIIRLKWASVTGVDQQVKNVAKVVVDYMTTAHGDMPALSSMPLHLIGHSRGAALVSQMGRFFGKRGVVVDHVTFLDPIPTAGVPNELNDLFGDGAIAAYDNVVFADTYWRSGGEALNGAHIDGTYDGDVNDTVGENHLFSAHMAVTAYYVGTINLTASSGGDHPIYSDWYGTTADKPARDQTGYAFSRLGAGVTRNTQGLGSLGGGSAERMDAGESGSQIPSALELKPRGGTEFKSGAKFSVSLRAGDRDDIAAATIYLDSDRNPFNSPAQRIGSASVTGDISESIINVRASGIAPGRYALATKLLDTTGNTVWLYGRSITITEADVFGSIANRVLTINSTDGGDGLSFSRNGGTVTAQLNGGTNTFAAADFDRIEIFAGAGDDIVIADPSIDLPVYVDGGIGNDNITTGSGNDTITGGAGKNTMNGAAGNDRINGSGGRDLIFGGEGADRLYGNGGDDTLDGGSGVDRAWAGDGNDVLIGGGGNDKLFGETGDDTLMGKAGADILDGGDGNDTSDHDALDSRSLIELLA